MKTSTPPLNRTPFTDLMLHPEKVEAVLKTAKPEDSTTSQSAARRAARSKTQKNSKGGSLEKSSSRSLCELKKTEFFLEAPAAKSVKLAADFTDWEKSSLDMMRSEDGVWFSVIPLSPGQYLYRFIVDEQWCDDPRSIQRVPNPFGTENGVVVVT
jgi:1,4-alpha-glucan branching enzyme